MTEEELLSLIAQKGRDVQQKTSDPGHFLSRTLAPLDALGSFPDLAYNALENPLMLPFLSTKYAANIAQGLGSMFLPGIIDVPEFKRTEDIMKKIGLTTGNEYGDMGVGLLGDIFLDPTTYMGLGIGKNIGKRLFTKAATKAI